MTDRRQRQKEARAAKREAQKKTERRKELSRRLTTAFVFGLVVVGVIVLTSVASNRGRPASAYEELRQQETACGAERPDPRRSMTFETPESQADITAGSRVTATVSTSCGHIVMELDPAGYPETVNSFVFLAREGFYNGQAFHRVYPDLVIQGGDPNADGTGGPGYTIADEWPQSDFDYEIGTVAMANRGSRTTGSQFFVVVSDNGRLLTNRFNILGRVVAGEDVIARILEIETTTTPGSAEQSFPLETVYIETVTIEVDGS
jgi:cyclophilin family peptidyl-prolyl cis-trans isomerase